MKSDAIFAKISESLKEIDHSNRSFTPTIQYNIRNSSGLIEKKMVVDLAKLEIYEGAVAADVTVEIDDDDMVNIGASKTTYEELIAAGKITTQGNADLLKTLDNERAKRLAK